jgi:hypothetical protein
MNNSKVWRWTVVFGLAAVALGLAQFPLHSTGSPPSVYEGVPFANTCSPSRTSSSRGSCWTWVSMLPSWCSGQALAS